MKSIQDIINHYKKEDKPMFNPHELSKPEGFCTTCKGFTTNYNNRGECSECGTEVTADISEGEEQ